MIEILRQLDNYRQFVFLQQLTQSLLATKAGWNMLRKSNMISMMENSTQIYYTRATNITACLHDSKRNCVNVYLSPLFKSQ